MSGYSQTRHAPDEALLLVLYLSIAHSEFNHRHKSSAQLPIVSYLQQYRTPETNTDTASKPPQTTGKKTIEIDKEKRQEKTKTNKTKLSEAMNQPTDRTTAVVTLAGSTL